MRALLLFAAIFLPITISAHASSQIAKDIENIDLNLKDHELAVSFLGLSEGEATLVQAADGKNILVNIGKNRQELSEWLSLYKVKEIDKLILTSAELVDVEFIQDVVSKYNIKELIAQPNIEKRLIENLDTATGSMIKSWNEGMKVQLTSETLAEVQFAGSNDGDGLDFTLQFFKHRLFFMTSVSKQAEKHLLRKNLGNIHIFKLPLITNKSTLSDQLIQHINPQIAMLFTFDHKSHPNSGLIEELQNNWSEVYYTKIHGTVTIKFTESSYEVFTIPSRVDE